jgi:NHL repeat-containing protein/strictosidine synthase-like protein
VSRTRALLTVAGAAALITITAPPVSADPAQKRPYSQLVPLADLDSSDEPGSAITEPGIEVTPDGTAYVTQPGKPQVYTVGPDGTVGTVPGAWLEPGEGADGYGPEASAVEVAADGTVHVLTDGTLRRVTPDGTGSVVAGDGDADFRDDENGGDGGPATDASLTSLQDLAIDAAGNRYVVDTYDNRVRRIDPNGVITTVAGGGYGDEDGVPAIGSALYDPRAVEVDPAGNVYVLEDRGRIRKISPDGTISTVIGDEGPGFSGDGGPAARGRIGGRGGKDWQGRGGLDSDAEGNLYFADPANGFVREIDAKGVLRTLGPLMGSDIAVAPNGDVYQVAADEVVVLRKETRTSSARVDATTPGWTNRAPGTVLRVAGTGKTPGYVPGDTLDSGPWVAAGKDGTAYVSDPLADQIYLITPDGRREPFAGTGERGQSGDGGPARRARLNHPTGVAVGPDGTVYVADHGNHRIRKITPDGTISTHAKSDATNLAVGGDGAVYAADSGIDQGIVKIDRAGRRTTVVGGGDGQLEPGKPATDAALSGNVTVAVSTDGTVYFAVGSSRTGIYRVERNGTVAALAQEGSGAFSPNGEPRQYAGATDISLAIGPDGVLYFTDGEDDQVRALAQDGTATVVAEFPEPTHVAVGQDGTRFVTGPDRHVLHRVAQDGSVLSDVALTDGETERATGPGAERPIESVQGLHVQPSGALAVTVIGGVLEVDPDGTIAPFRNFATPDDYSGVDGEPLAFGPDGSVYAKTVTAGVERFFPDGTRQPLVGRRSIDATTAPEGSPAVMQRPEVSGAAVTPDGDLYLTVGNTLYRVDEDDALVKATTFDKDASSLTAAPDGALLVIVGDRVLRVDERHRVSTVAGGGTFDDYDENGDGGPATEADLDGPEVVAMSPNGYLYIGTDDGIRRVTPDGTIGTFPTRERRYSGYDPVEHLAVDRHGTVYYGPFFHDQVTAIVRADAVELPTDDPFPWWAVIWGAVLAVLGAGGWWYLRHRSAQADSTVHDGQKDDADDADTDAAADADTDQPSTEPAPEPDQEPEQDRKPEQDPS